MPIINLGTQKINKEEGEYIINAIRFLDNPTFLGQNFITNINFFIKMIAVHREEFLRVGGPPDHLIAYLWLLKEVAEEIKE